MRARPGCSCARPIPGRRARCSHGSGSSSTEQSQGGADAAGEALVAARLGAAAVAPEAIVSALVEAGVRVRGFDVERASLEQRFVELTGEGFDIVQ